MNQVLLNQFNVIHILSFTILPMGLFLALYFFLKNKSDNNKKYILLAICGFNIVLYIVYKIYQAFFYDSYDFVLAYNLPLHFCNLNLFLLPLAIITSNKTLMAYQVYFGTILAFFALITIDTAFRGEPFFEFTCLVYYYYHSMLTVLPILLISFKMFKPLFKTIWQPVLLMIIMTFIAHIVNIIFRMTGIAENANYFFTYGLAGDPFTEIFKAIIPYNFFFLIPIIFLFLPYIVLIVLLCRIQYRRS